MRKPFTRFGLDAKAVSAEENPIEKTTALVATVETLEPGGKAQIAYILGYKSKKLIQVNVVWGAPVDPGITAEKLTGTAVLLRNYFTQQPFAPDRRQQDQRLQDGSIVFFQGTDAQDRQVSLHLLGVPLSTKEGEKPKVGYSLRLSYVADPKSPDIPTQGGVILTEDRSQKTEVSGSVSNLTSDFSLPAPGYP